MSHIENDYSDLKFSGGLSALNLVDEMAILLGRHAEHTLKKLLRMH